MEARRPEAETIGERVRRLRVEQGKSQREIEGPGADHAHISRVEAGQRRATERFLTTVAKNLGVSVDYLRHGEEGSGSERRRAELDDVELRLRLDPAADRANLIEALRELHADAVVNGDFGVVRRCRLLIGCSASDRGEHATAVRELERVVNQGWVTPLGEPDVYLSLGRSLAAVGRADDAVALFEKCLESIQQQAPQDQVAFVRFSTYLSYALVDAGEIRRAKKVLWTAISRAEGLDDTSSLVRLYYSRARLAWAECDWEHGRAYAERAIVLLQASEDRQDLVRLYLLRADMSLVTGEIDDAEESVREAERLLALGADVQDVGSLRYQQAFIAAAQGRSDEAIALAHDAIELLAQDPAVLGRAYWALAEAFVAAGRYEEALDAYRDAYQLMAIEKRFLAQLLRSWAETLRELGRHEEVGQIFLDAIDGGVLTSALV